MNRQFTMQRARWIWRNLLLRSGIPTALDRRAFAAAFGPAQGPTQPHVLLVAPGAGNVGDQAMFEAYLENVDGSITVIVRRDGDVVVPPSDTTRVRIVPMPQLVYGLGRAHRKEVAESAELLSGATSFSVIGADIMDGRYVLRASVARSVLAGAAAEHGIPTRILGFSWSGSAQPAARRALAAASRRGARSLVRDPVSLRRAQHDGIVDPQLVADIVFTAQSIDGSWAARYATERPLAIVNVSGLIAGDVDQTSEYATIVDYLVTQGRDVLVLPHVSRPGADDMIACRALVERVGADHVTLARSIPTPAQVRGLTESADIVVTGRMHLAIMSLMLDTPAITLATQGKVEGLMELAGAPELCVTPAAGFGDDVADLLEKVLPAESTTRQAVAAHTPRLRDLALRNVEGL